MSSKRIRDIWPTFIHHIQVEYQRQNFVCRAWKGNEKGDNWILTKLKLKEFTGGKRGGKKEIEQNKKKKERIFLIPTSYTFEAIGSIVDVKHGG